MKVQASVKKMCRNCKVIRRNGVVRVICSRTRATSSARAELLAHGVVTGYNYRFPVSRATA